MTHKDSSPLPHSTTPFSSHQSPLLSTAGAVTSRPASLSLSLSLSQSLPAASQQSLVDRVTELFPLPCGVFISNKGNRSPHRLTASTDKPVTVSPSGRQRSQSERVSSAVGDGQTRAGPASRTAARTEVPRWVERLTQPWTSAFNAQHKEGGSFFRGIRAERGGEMAFLTGLNPCSYNDNMAQRRNDKSLQTN